MSYSKKMPLVVIFGRTNVGKSTLFNCLIQKKQAMMSGLEGTTRDSNIGQVSWGGRDFTIVDTGGIMDLKYLSAAKIPAQNGVEAEVQKQVRGYLEQADLILFLVDSKAGLLPPDKQIALMIKKIILSGNGKSSASAKKKLKKEIILVANKTDGVRERNKIAEFYKLSLGEPAPISSISGSGTGDLLDIIIDKLPKSRSKSLPAKSEEEEVKVCILGKPNVGKSSLLNSILGEERVIVSPIPHTTREPQDTDLIYKNHSIKLVDTAGISRQGQKIRTKNKNKNELHLVKEGIAKSLLALNRVDIALFVLDINAPITHQDSKIIEEIVNRKKSIILIANKWDLISEKDIKKYTRHVYAKLPFVRWVPIHFASALRGGKKIEKIMDMIVDISELRKKEITKSQLNAFLRRIVKIHRPTKGKGFKRPFIYELEQTKTNPPEFIIRIGAREIIHFSYVRFIENRLRQEFGLLGTPITIGIIKRKIVHGKHDPIKLSNNS